MSIRIHKDILAFKVRRSLLVSLGVSMFVHVAAIAWLGYSRSGRISAEALVSSNETLLTFTEPEPLPEATPAPPQEELQPQETPPLAPPPELTETTVPKVVQVEPPPTPKIAAPPLPPRPAPPAPQPQVKRAEPPRNTVFAGVQARRAQRIVYVVDASGPMASSLAFVKGELARSIGALAPDQSFQVLFFREAAGGSSHGQAFEAFAASAASPQLMPATKENKSEFAAWLQEIRPTGRSNPQPALEEAMRLGPDLVFLLSRRIKRTNLADAAGEVRQIVAALDRLNPVDVVTGKRAVVIKTIQFLDDDPSGLLQNIAQSHGDGEGSYRLLTLDQLPRR